MLIFLLQPRSLYRRTVDLGPGALQKGLGKAEALRSAVLGLLGQRLLPPQGEFSAGRNTQARPSFDPQVAILPILAGERVDGDPWTPPVLGHIERKALHLPIQAAIKETPITFQREPNGALQGELERTESRRFGQSVR